LEVAVGVGEDARDERAPVAVSVTRLDLNVGYSVARSPPHDLAGYV